MSNPVLAAGSLIPTLPATPSGRKACCVRHPPPYAPLEVSPSGMWQPITLPQATASSDGNSVLLAPEHMVPAESQASPLRPEWWDPALSQGDISLAVMFLLVIPPHPFAPTS